MGKTPDLKRITTEDFPQEDQDLIQKVGFVINSFNEQVRNLFNKNIDFQNLAQELKTLTFVTNGNGQPLNELSFRSDLNNRVQGIMVVRAVITTSNTASVNTSPVITWSQNANTVTITNIGGLSPETGYQLSLLTL